MRTAKFGIFIHWGLYAVPAFDNEWYPRNMYRQGTKEFEHHVATYGPQTEFGYKDFIPLFKAEHFDPDAWAALFAEAGARFVVPVAEHHDGFAMYDSCDCRAGRRPRWGRNAISSASWPQAVRGAWDGVWRLQPPRRALVVYERRAQVPVGRAGPGLRRLLWPGHAP